MAVPRHATAPRLPDWFQFGLAFLGSCGLALDATGRLYSGEGSESGYPFAVFILPLHLLSNAFVILLGATRARFTESQLLLLVCLTTYSVLLGADFVIGLIAIGDADFFNYLVHVTWVLATINGVLTFINGGTNAFLRGMRWALTFLLAYNVADVGIELLACGPLLCGLGRTSSSFGMPGLYQEYVYMPTLICVLLAARLRTRQVGLFTFLVAGAVIVSTGSREGILLFVCSVCLSAAYYKRHEVRKSWVIVGMIALGSIVALSASTLDFEDLALFEKFSAIETQFYGDNSRIEIIKLHVDLWKDSPLFGNYMRHPSSPYSLVVIDQPSAHNGYADALATGGLFYFVLLSSLLAWFATTIWKGDRQRNVQRHFPFFLVMFLAISMNINVPLRAPLLTYSLCGVIGLLMAASDRSHRGRTARGRTKRTVSAARELRGGPGLGQNAV